MLSANKPPLEEVYLEHFGVKGMRWGVRRPQLTKQQKVKTTVAAGSLATAVVLHSFGILGWALEKTSELAVRGLVTVGEVALTTSINIVGTPYLFIKNAIGG